MNSIDEGFYGRVVIDEGSEGMSSRFNVNAYRKHQEGKKEKHLEVVGVEEDGGGLLEDISGSPEDDYARRRPPPPPCRMLVHGDGFCR